MVPRLDIPEEIENDDGEEEEKNIIEAMNAQEKEANEEWDKSI